MAYFTLDDVAMLAKKDGWPVESTYSYKDDATLKAFLLFKYQLNDYEKIKTAALLKSKTALDPDIKFCVKKQPRVGSFLPIICKVHPGLMLGKTEPCTFTSSTTLYILNNNKVYTEVPAGFELTYNFNCEISIFCIPENESAISIKIVSDHLNEYLNISSILPLQLDGINPDKPSANSILGACKLGEAILQ